MNWKPLRQQEALPHQKESNIDWLVLPEVQDGEFPLMEVGSSSGNGMAQMNRVPKDFPCVWQLLSPPGV